MLAKFKGWYNFISIFIPLDPNLRQSLKIDGTVFTSTHALGKLSHRYSILKDGVLNLIERMKAKLTLNSGFVKYFPQLLLAKGRFIWECLQIPIRSKLGSVAIQIRLLGWLKLAHVCHTAIPRKQCVDLLLVQNQDLGKVLQCLQIKGLSFGFYMYVETAILVRCRAMEMIFRPLSHFKKTGDFFEIVRILAIKDF
jgi:hypothetical protein